jgi:hypothetical protein
LPVSKTFFFSFESSEAYTGLQFNWPSASVTWLNLCNGCQESTEFVWYLARNVGLPLSVLIDPFIDVKGRVSRRVPLKDWLSLSYSDELRSRS